MKIVCDSCGAKYSIADEKVAGRVFKIRCKKCGAAIVVRGDQSAQEAAASGAAPAAGFDYGGEAVWHVVVEGEQQGPFSPAQLGGMISANTIGWDAYVWREGFEDWKPAQDIEELVQAIMNPGAGAGGAAEQASHDADPFAEPAAAAPAASAPAAAKADAGADLFAQSDAASPFGGGANPFGGGGDDEDVVASSPSPRVSASQAMTGARNENSVLFSLSNLQALATGGSASGGSASGGGSSSAASSSKSSPAPRGGMAAGEGSGLIDIRALASATGVSGGPAPSLSFGGPSSSPARVDDLLSIGTAAPGLGSALGAPVIIPEKKESGGGRGMMIGAGVLVVAMMCATGVFAMVMMNNQPDPATAIAAVPVGATGALAPGAAAAGTPGADGTPTTTGAAPAAGTADPAAAEPAATGTAGTAAAAEAEEEDDEDEDSARSGRRRGSRGGRSSATPAPSASEGASGGSASAASSGSSARRGGGGGGGSGDIDDLLGRALAGGSGGGGGGGGGSAPAEDLPEQPARAAVISALNGVQGAVSACGQGQHGMATVAITVAGSTGRVSGANVTGQFGGTPVGSCVARAVRGARFPRFSRATFVINYPFRI